MKKGMIFLELLVYFVVILLINNGATETSTNKTTDTTIQNFPSPSSVERKISNKNPIRSFPEPEWTKTGLGEIIGNPIFLKTGEILLNTKQGKNKHSLIRLNEKGNIISTLDIPGENVFISGDGEGILAVSKRIANVIPDDNTDEGYNRINYYDKSGKLIWGWDSPWGYYYSDCYISDNHQTIICHPEAERDSSKLYFFDSKGNLNNIVDNYIPNSLALSSDGNYAAALIGIDEESNDPKNYIRKLAIFNNKGFKISESKDDFVSRKVCISNVTNEIFVIGRNNITAIDPNGTKIWDANGNFQFLNFTKLGNLICLYNEGIKIIDSNNGDEIANISGHPMIDTDDNDQIFICNFSPSGWTVCVYKKDGIMLLQRFYSKNQLSGFDFIRLVAKRKKIILMNHGMIYADQVNSGWIKQFNFDSVELDK